jgi:hypothetical protein
MRDDRDDEIHTKSFDFHVSLRGYRRRHVGNRGVHTPRSPKPTEFAAECDAITKMQIANCRRKSAFLPCISEDECGLVFLRCRFLR